jgi:hypothetical protein
LSEAITFLYPWPQSARFHATPPLVYAFIKGAIKLDVKEDGRKEIGEEVENDGRR